MEAVEEKRETEGVEDREDVGERRLGCHKMALSKLGQVPGLLGVAQRRPARQLHPHQHIKVYQSPWQLQVVADDREGEPELVWHFEHNHSFICRDRAGENSVSVYGLTVYTTTTHKVVTLIHMESDRLTD